MRLTSSSSVVVVVWVCCVATVVMATERTLHYNVSEEVDPGTVVGDFKRDYYASRAEAAAAEGHDLSALTFSFRSASRYFRIDVMTGVIVTLRRIDREQLCARQTQSCDAFEQTLDVIVTPTEYFVIAKVKVTVNDVNDNAPTFPVAEVSLVVWDNSPLGALFQLPYAEDLDSGALGVQGYSLEGDGGGGGRGKFDLKVTDMLDGSHDVRLQLKERLLAEVQRTHSLTVVAKDGGSPVRTGTVRVEVTVRAVADVRPRFDRPFTASVVENCPLGRWVTQVQAVSAAAAAGSHQVLYSLLNRPPEVGGDRKLFRIDPRSGSVYVAGSIDYETDHVFPLTVVAAASGRSAMTSLTVEVVDVNDNAPEIAVNTLLRSGRGQVTENAPNGTFVAHVTVRDPDSGDNGWSACLTTSTLFLLQELSPSEYKMTTTVSLDREEETRHRVKVVCHDFGTPSLTSSVALTVDVLDENDNDPRFPRDRYSVAKGEDFPPGSVLTTISASDADDVINALLSYSLTSLDVPPSDVLAIDYVTGDVRVVAPLDYEAKVQHEYLVTVKDGGTPKRSATATLTLTVIDVNDGVPRFSRSSYLFSVVDGRPPGSPVGRVEATDTDGSEVNRNSTFVVEDSTFEVDPLSGWIRAKRVLGEGEVFEFSVEVINLYSSVQLNSSANVTVVVNRTLPSFIFPSSVNHSVLVDLDSVKVGDVIAEVRVERRHDDDADLRYGLAFEAAEGEEEEEEVEGHLFHLEERTGRLFLSGEPVLDRIYRLTIKVQTDADVECALTGRLDVHVTSSSSSSSSSSFHLLRLRSWFDQRETLMTLVGVVVGIVVVVVIISIAVCMKVKRSKQSKSRGEYDCRYSVNRAPKKVKGDGGSGDVIKGSESVVLQNCILMSNSSKQKTPIKKKEVTFSIDDVDDDEIDEKMFGMYKGNQFIYPKSCVKSSCDALLNSPEDSDSIGSDSGKGASEEGDTSAAPGANRYAPRGHHGPHNEGSVRITSPQTSLTKGSKVTLITPPPPPPPQIILNSRIPPQPTATNTSSMAMPSMVTFKSCHPLSYSPTGLHHHSTEAECSSAPGECDGHSPGGARAALSSDGARRLRRSDAEFATDV